MAGCFIEICLKTALPQTRMLYNHAGKRLNHQILCIVNIVEIAVYVKGQTAAMSFHQRFQSALVAVEIAAVEGFIAYQCHSPLSVSPCVCGRALPPPLGRTMTARSKGDRRCTPCCSIGWRAAPARPMDTTLPELKCSKCIWEGVVPTWLSAQLRMEARATCRLWLEIFTLTDI